MNKILQGQMLHERVQEILIRSLTKQKQKLIKWSENQQGSQDFSLLYVSLFLLTPELQHEVHSKISSQQHRFLPMNIIINSETLNWSRIPFDLYSRHFVILPISTDLLVFFRIPVVFLVMSFRPSITFLILTTINHRLLLGLSIRCSLLLQISNFPRILS